jgi:hypothetical protein
MKIEEDTITFNSGHKEFLHLARTLGRPTGHVGKQASG